VGGVGGKAVNERYDDLFNVYFGMQVGGGG